MAWTKAKTAMAIGAGVLLAAGITTAVVMADKDPNRAAMAKGQQMIAKHIAGPLDLTANYTTPISRFDHITGFPAWKTVPRGFQTFANVPLQIEGMICLWAGVMRINSKSYSRKKFLHQCETKI